MSAQDHVDGRELAVFAQCAASYFEGRAESSRDLSKDSPAALAEFGEQNLDSLAERIAIDLRLCIKDKNWARFTEHLVVYAMGLYGDVFADAIAGRRAAVHTLMHWHEKFDFVIRDSRATFQSEFVAELISPVSRGKSKRLIKIVRSHYSRSAR